MTPYDGFGITTYRRGCAIADRNHEQAQIAGGGAFATVLPWCLDGGRTVRPVQDLARKLGHLLQERGLRKWIGSANQLNFELNYTLARFERNMSACLSASMKP